MPMASANFFCVSFSASFFDRYRALSAAHSAACSGFRVRFGLLMVRIIRHQRCPMGDEQLRDSLGAFVPSLQARPKQGGSTYAGRHAYAGAYE